MGSGVTGALSTEKGVSCVLIRKSGSKRGFRLGKDGCFSGLHSETGEVTHICHG